MWIMGTDFFLSVVRKDCSPGQLLVRARREGDIEKVFGQVEVQRDTTADYLFRARIDEEAVASAMRDQLLRIDYGNYKSAADKDMPSSPAGMPWPTCRTRPRTPAGGFPRSIFKDDPPPKKRRR